MPIRTDSNTANAIPLTLVAHRLRVSYQTAHRLVLVGVLVGEKTRTGWRVDANSLDAYLARRQAQTAGAA